MTELQTIKLWLENAQAIVINTGAGMGRDSGLPDYRGEGGQWGAVETENDGKTVFDVVNPQSFIDNPKYVWEMFGSRLQQYHDTPPHEGFYILKKWIAKYNLDYFALTSNIDGHFQKAGFEENKVRELHGTLAYFQEQDTHISSKIWKNEISGNEIVENAKKGIFPISPFTGLPARPNVYMFRDATYVNTHSKAQDANFQAFLEKNKGKNMVVFEIGSGPHVQTVRIKTRMLKTEHNAKVIRINPNDFAIKPPHIGINKGALVALKEIDKILNDE